MAIGPRLAGLSGATPRVDLAHVEFADHHTRNSLRFLVLGDGGTGNENQRLVARGMDQVCRARGGCDFALVTGDNIYPDGVSGISDERFETRFEDPYRFLPDFHFWLVTGNHDWYRKDSARTEVLYSGKSDRWRMPALDYEIPKLPDWLRVYGLDSTLIVEGLSTGQVARAREALCGGDGWRIVFAHHGLYTVGKHGGGDNTLRKVEEELLDPLIKRCDVHVYFAGHEHLQAHLSAPAFEQFVQGAAGGSLHTPNRRHDRPLGVKRLETHKSFGFALVEATPSSLAVSFYDVDESRFFYCREISLSGFDMPETRFVEVEPDCT